MVSSNKGRDPVFTIERVLILWRRGSDGKAGLAAKQIALAEPKRVIKIYYLFMAPFKAG
jgi:hypothetical protein